VLNSLRSWRFQHPAVHNKKAGARTAPLLFCCLSVAAYFALVLAAAFLGAAFFAAGFFAAAFFGAAFFTVAFFFGAAAFFLGAAFLGAAFAVAIAVAFPEWVDMLSGMERTPHLAFAHSFGIKKNNIRKIFRCDHLEFLLKDSVRWPYTTRYTERAYLQGMSASPASPAASAPACPVCA
jgi:hypothetical protein